eukprot:4451615-Lingulodinium_polyedra.AAC.1
MDPEKGMYINDVVQKKVEWKSALSNQHELLYPQMSVGGDDALGDSKDEAASGWLHAFLGDQG